MIILKALSALLSYPNQDLIDALDEITRVIADEDLLSDSSGLMRLIETLRKGDLIDLQESYVNQFDRGHSLSLHIFEHVHGQSKDRGQAMVNLLGLYQSNGFELAVQELPDYIPLFLEFLSTRCPHSGSQEKGEKDLSDALSILNDAMPVMSLLAARLKNRESPYQAIFDALHQIAGVPHQPVEVTDADESLQRMDEIWEEEVVSFMGNQCRNSDENPVMIKPRKN